MERNTENNDGDFELAEVNPSWRQKLLRNASDSSLLSAPVSDENFGEHVDALEAAESPKTFTADEEKAVVRKLDRRLVLFIAFLYMLSFLDRSSEYKRIYTTIGVLPDTAIY